MSGKYFNPLALNAGDLRHQIQIQAQVSDQDEFGAEVQIWNTMCTCFAAIVGMSSREVFRAQQFAAQVTHQITIRYRGDVAVAAGMRVSFGSRIFAIQSIENVQERNRVLHLMVQEINGVTV